MTVWGHDPMPGLPLKDRAPTFPGSKILRFNFSILRFNIFILRLNFSELWLNFLLLNREMELLKINRCRKEVRDLSLRYAAAF